MLSYTKCAFCHQRGHTLHDCGNPAIDTQIQHMENHIAKEYTWANLTRFFRDQLAINVRILARKNGLNIRIQKAFLNEQLVEIYYNKHKIGRMREIGELVARHMDVRDTDVFICDFRIEQLDEYLYQHLTRNIQQMNLHDPVNVVDKLNYISRDLDSLYNNLYLANALQNERYREFMTIIYNRIMQIQHTLRSRLMRQFHIDDIDADTTPIVITPYLLVSYPLHRSRAPKYCPICMDNAPNNEIVLFKCGHQICNTCLQTQIEVLNRSERAAPFVKCSICRENVHEIYTPNKKIYAEYESDN
jgi:hypothetical protein